MNLRVAIIHRTGIAAAAVDAAERGLRARGVHVDRRATGDLAAGSREARDAVAAGARVVLAAGGDGTVLSALDACVASGADLAVLPLGTANDLATHLAMQSAADVVEAVASGARARADVGRCRYVAPDGERAELPFLTTAGIGVLADVARRERAGAPALLKRALGNAAWPLLLAGSWFARRPVPARLELDGRAVDAELSLFEICKVPAPGGFLLAPDAALDSGILHAWGFGPGGIPGFAADLARGVLGRAAHLRSPRIEYVSHDPGTNRWGASGVRRIAINPAEPLAVQLNGEYVGTTPVEFEVVRAAVGLVVPRART